ncbi:AAA domain-containing protein [Leekyejoonella antrihumi]|uniref:DUF4011 domain-containing protein n=1 Tax=Leekyejoonella antrihumi TaxID=1660198 RepID=A0A563E7W6_9MICO|nr:AAA domain-containing protein [Leekyejoonella antrihumi]TWP38626.1 DUF4011 domain-containing protein [Leekyejoonella antrihumi]
MTTSTEPVQLEAQGANVSRADRVARSVTTWQRHLSDLGGRNALLWFRDLPDTTLDLTGAHPAGQAKLFSAGAAPLSELVRQPTMLTDATRRARAIRDKAGELYAERGITTCYLASGMARWRIPGSSRTPVAPVLLRPCVIRPTGRDGRDLAIELGDRLEVNAALVAYLTSECGISLDTAQICALASRGSGSDPAAAFQAVRQACADVADFRIDPRLVVGLFATVKLPLVRDLADQRDGLAAHHVVAALAGDPEAAQQVGAEPPQTGVVDLDREHLAVDADREQQDVVEGVRAGAHMVVEGPPGTGKTQTAANLVAALTADGRRTLFVAHKRASIDGVRERLEQAGLGDLLLDLYAEHAAPGRFAGYLVRLLDERCAAPVMGNQAPSNLVSRREQLQAHARAMHRVRGPWGISLDEAQSRVSELEERKPAPRSRVRLRGDDLAGISRARRDELRTALHETAGMGAWTVGGDPDPWFGARVVGEHQGGRTRELVERLAGGGLKDHRRVLEELCDTVGLPAPHTMRRAEEQLELMGQVHSTLETFRPAVFDAPIADLAAATGGRDYRTEHDIDQGSLERRRLRKQAESLLRPGPPPRGIHGVLVRAAAQQARWRDAAGAGSRPAAPVNLPEIAQSHERLRLELEWLGARLTGTAEGGDLLDADLDVLERRLTALAGAPDRLAKVPEVIGALDKLRANGLGPFIDDVAARHLSAEQVAAEFEFVWWTSLLGHVGGTDPVYEEHDGATLRRIAGDYLDDDTAQVRRSAQQVRDALVRQAQRTDRDLPDQSEVLRDEAASRAYTTPRELLGAVPEIVGALAPCWAMSPLEVPVHVPAGMWFDVVIFDEGSQVDLATAIPAISRASQVVVLGDSQQLPPAPLRMTAGDDEQLLARTEPESLLDVLRPLVPVRSLATHYRSHDERLIAFANAQMYATVLETFPGTADDGVLRLDVVSGSSTGGESAAPEVDRVVQLVLDHLRKQPGESLGVVTLGVRHAQRIQDALRAALAGQPDLLEAVGDDRREPFFVKSVDQVQGDVRDAIIFTVGYGRGPGGEVQHRFGALSAAGGERRLNVAMTRARRRMVVVSSFSGGELDPSRLRSRGATMLRDFLLYAASGGSARRVAGGVAPMDRQEASSGPEAVSETGRGDRRPDGAPLVGPSGRRRRMASTGSVLDRPTLPPAEVAAVTPLVTDLARRLRAEGLVVRTGHGAGRHRIDIAVEDPRRPGSLLVAIETDGPAYGAMEATRDRDRLRVQQLQRLGWTCERAWTRDLFRDPAKELSRLVSAVHSASCARAAGHRDG